MKKSANKSRSIMITLAISGAAVAYSFLVFLPSQKALSRLRQQLRDKQQQIVDSDRLISAITQTELNLTAAKEFTATWQRNSPTESRISELYRRFATMADAAKIQLNGIRPQSSERMKTISQHRVSLECSGTYGGLFEFLHQIESAAPALWIQQLELDQPDPQKDQVRGKLLLTIFVDNLSVYDDNRENSG